MFVFDLMFYVFAIFDLFVLKTGKTMQKRRRYGQKLKVFLVIILCF